MSEALFTCFPKLCCELQFEVWEMTIGAPRIHIMRPPTSDDFRWSPPWDNGFDWNLESICPFYLYVFWNLVDVSCLVKILPCMLLYSSTIP